MSKLFVGLYFFFTEKLVNLDRRLCRKLHWYLRLHWCSLWVRRDRFHPAFDFDEAALNSKKRLYGKLLNVWMDITRARPTPTSADMADEFRRLKNLEDCLHDEYVRDLAHRRNEASLQK